MALSYGYAMKKPRGDAEIVREVAAELAVNVASDITQGAAG